MSNLQSDEKSNLGDKIWKQLSVLTNGTTIEALGQGKQTILIRKYRTLQKDFLFIQQ